MTILFATNNYSKAHRFDEGLRKYGIEVISLKDLNLSLDIKEIGTTAIENALIKARCTYEKTKMTTIGMDDTLYLEGIPETSQPGLFVRRVGDRELTDSEMIEHYINLVNKYGKNGKLKAKWKYGLVLINNDKEYLYTFEKEGFYLTNKKSNKVNPGYPLNTISVNEKLNKYFTDMTSDDWKNDGQDENDVIDFIVKYSK